MRNKLTLYIFIALVLGIISGWLCNINASNSFVIGFVDYVPLMSDIFLNLVKMIIAPLVFSTLVVGVAKAEVGTAGRIAGGAAAFILVMFLVARPLLIRYAALIDRRQGGRPAYAIASVYVLILSAAALTEWIGIHAIFGAFLLGVVIPSESGLANSFLSKLKEPVTVLLLPAFFAYTGMRTEIGLLNNWSQWAICAAILGVATLGKFGGTFIAARCAGETWRDAGILGMLMNTRGLMELIVLNIGLDLGVVSPTLFAMMVIMALVTTMITSPVIQLLSPEEGAGRV